MSSIIGGILLFIVEIWTYAFFVAIAININNKASNKE
jgi:hypothetical protein